MTTFLRGLWALPALVGVSMLIWLVFMTLAVVGPWVAPVDPNLQDLSNRLLPPGSEGHLLGTDALGRDVLSRLIAGSRVTMIVAFSVVGLSGFFGSLLGLISGYFGGALDTAIMRAADVWLAFPFLILAIALVAVLGSGIDKVVLALVLAGWVFFARPVRSEVASLRERDYVASAKALGASHGRRIFLHILPNVLPTIIVVAALELGIVIIAEASLSFLGLGVGGGRPTWGGMLAAGRSHIGIAWWLATLPGLAIFALVVAVNIVGDWLRDVFDPRLGNRRSESMHA